MEILDMLVTLVTHWKQRALKAEEALAKSKQAKPEKAKEG